MPDDSLVREDHLRMGSCSFMSRQLGAPRGDAPGERSWQEPLQRPVLLGEAGILTLGLCEEDGDGRTWTTGMPSSSREERCWDSGGKDRGVVLELESSVGRQTGHSQQHDKHQQQSSSSV